MQVMGSARAERFTWLSLLSDDTAGCVIVADSGPTEFGHAPDCRGAVGSVGLAPIDALSLGCLLRTELSPFDR